MEQKNNLGPIAIASPNIVLVKSTLHAVGSTFRLYRSACAALSPTCHIQRGPKVRSLPLLRASRAAGADSRRMRASHPTQMLRAPAAPQKSAQQGMLLLHPSVSLLHIQAIFPRVPALKSLSAEHCGRPYI
jgi:hypothetical protein